MHTDSGMTGISLSGYMPYMTVASLEMSDEPKNFLFKILNHFSTKNTLLVGHFFGKAPFPKTSFPRKWLGIQRYVNFENLLLPIPFEAEKYLSLRYGSDFMKIPNSDIFTEYPIHAVFVDIHNDYTIYKDKFNS